MEGRSGDQKVGPRGGRSEGRRVDRRGDHLGDLMGGRSEDLMGGRMEGQTVGVKAAWRRSRRVEPLPLGKSLALLQQGRRQAKKRALTARGEGRPQGLRARARARTLAQMALVSTV